jgi:RNA polymerase sigma factor (sigma-70 family)
MDSNKQVEFFTNFYVKDFNMLKSYAYGQTKDWIRAEEVAQDTFFIAWTRIEHFMASPNPTGWLINTLKYTMKNVERKDAIKAYWITSLEEIGEVQCQGINEPDSIISERCEEILSKEELFLLKRVVLDQTPYKEMSEELNIGLWACQKRMQRIFKKIRDNFK